jgi:integrase
MPRRKRREKGKPWLRRLSNGILRWYLLKGYTSGKLVPVTRRDRTFIDGADAEDEAMQAWHEIMCVTEASEKGEDNEVRVVLDLYLQSLKKRAGKKTVDEYVKMFRSFRDKWPGLLVRELRSTHVEKWWEDCHPGWGDSTQNYSATALLAALNWATKPDTKLIPSNPLKGMVKPHVRSRGADTLISDHDHEKLLAAVPEDLRIVLIALRYTGTRPSIVSRVTAEDFDAERGTWRIKPKDHKTGKKTGRPLILGLHQVVVDLCKQLAANHPEGPLFLTKKGEPWHAQKLASRILWYAKKLNVRVISYGYRHTLATDMLLEGVPDTTVAAFLGHKNTDALHKNYSHLDSKIQHLRGVITNHMDKPSQESKAATAFGGS